MTNADHPIAYSSDKKKTNDKKLNSFYYCSKLFFYDFHDVSQIKICLQRIRPINTETKCQIQLLPSSCSFFFFFCFIPAFYIFFVIFSSFILISQYIYKHVSFLNHSMDLIHVISYEASMGIKLFYPFFFIIIFHIFIPYYGEIRESCNMVVV